MKKQAMAAFGSLVLAAAGIAVAASPASAVRICTHNNTSCAAEYDSWAGVESQDTSCDNNDVYAVYRRTQQSGYNQQINNSSGCDRNVRTGADSGNYVYRMQSCTNDAGPNTCSGWLWR